MIVSFLMRAGIFVMTSGRRTHELAVCRDKLGAEYIHHDGDPIDEACQKPLLISLNNISLVM